MVFQNEIVMLLISVSVAVFIYCNRTDIVRIRHYTTLLWAYVFFCIAGLATVLEGFFFPVLLNYSEHISYVISSCFFLSWVCPVCNHEEENPV